MLNRLCHSWWQVDRGVEAKPLANGQLFKLYFIQATSPCTIVPDIHVVWIVSPPCTSSTVFLSVS
jgi:hypothetical protein